MRKNLFVWEPCHTGYQICSILFKLGNEKIVSKMYFPLIKIYEKAAVCWGKKTRPHPRPFHDTSDLRSEDWDYRSIADHVLAPQSNMASKRIITGQSMSSIQSSLPLGLSAVLREEKKPTRPTSVQQLNEISITLQGQQTVQEIVNKATQLFQCLQETSMVVDEKSKQEVRNNNKKVQEALNGLKELFSRLRVFYDESNRRIEIPQGEDLEVGLVVSLSTQLLVPPTGTGGLYSYISYMVMCRCEGYGFQAV